jgi:hypothetical protein
MRTIRAFYLVAAAFLFAAAAAPAQNTAIDGISKRLEILEQQNAELLKEVRLLRQEIQNLKPASPPAAASESAAGGDERLRELEEKVEVQGARLTEQEEVKIGTSQRVPVRLTGMALFNAFHNGRNGGSAQNPLIASPNLGSSNSGATLRQSVIGLDFDSPEALHGAKIHGSLIMDLYGGSSDVLGNLVRLRTAFLQAQWGGSGFLVGQEKPIFSPREPNSLAQVGISPLTAAGNLWRWQPQVRFEQRVGLSRGQDLQARIGVVETWEAGAQVPPEYSSSLEHYRPALEGRFQFARRFDEDRRIEIAPGFHVSTTHVAHTSVPSSVFSLDWFFNPSRRLEFTGALFSGQNLANLGGGGVGQGFTILAPRPGMLQVIPVRSRGGWAQCTFIATPRLSFNLYGGEDDPNNRDLLPTGIARNLAYAANVFYRLAPNVVVGAEASQVRTWFMRGQRPLHHHYDLAVAYLF